ncbi:unnamed protein product [Clonostachys byssicola]|uniref:Uncharacterized protein n=1 Tax=Clonostachys byssicola TaxID=160290 RepID=A0A9N9XZG8_9HYPO|nr:unnamed protein product [Clonostachys byssicola]
MMLYRAIVAAGLFVTALADGPAIVSALEKITGDTKSLNDDVSSWNGGLLGTIPIVAGSTTLLASIHEGQKTAEASEPLTLLDAIGVAVATQALAKEVNTTISTIVGAKPKFDHLLLGPVILINLELEKKATVGFSDAIIEKLPVEQQPLGAELVKPILDSFDLAIDVYNPF